MISTLLKPTPLRVKFNLDRLCQIGSETVHKYVTEVGVPTETLKTRLAGALEDWKDS